MLICERGTKAWHWDREKQWPVRRWVKGVHTQNDGTVLYNLKYKWSDYWLRPFDLFATEEECWEAHAGAILAK